MHVLIHLLLVFIFIVDVKDTHIWNLSMLGDVGLSNKNIIGLDDLDIKDIIDCLLGLVDVVEFDMSS